MRSRGALRAFVIGAHALFLAVSCRQLLGIEDAQTDAAASQASGGQSGHGGEGAEPSTQSGGAGAATAQPAWVVRPEPAAKPDKLGTPDNWRACANAIARR